SARLNPYATERARPLRGASGPFCVRGLCDLAAATRRDDNRTRAKQHECGGNTCEPSDLTALGAGGSEHCPAACRERNRVLDGHVLVAHKPACCVERNAVLTHAQ